MSLIYRRTLVLHHGARIQLFRRRCKYPDINMLPVAQFQEFSSLFILISSMPSWHTLVYFITACQQLPRNRIRLHPSGRHPKTPMETPYLIGWEPERETPWDFSCGNGSMVWKSMISGAPITTFSCFLLITKGSPLLSSHEGFSCFRTNISRLLLSKRFLSVKSECPTPCCSSFFNLCLYFTTTEQDWVKLLQIQRQLNIIKYNPFMITPYLRIYTIITYLS